MQASPDARGLEPLGDDQFWGFIEILGGKTWQRTIAKLDAALSREDDEMILRFAQTLNAKLHAIDYPEFCERRVDDAGEVFWDANLSRHHRGAVIAGGRERFDLIVADPSLFNDKWLADMSWAVATVADEAWRRKHRDVVSIATTFSPEPGSNAYAWSNTAGAVRIGEILPSKAQRALWDAALGFATAEYKIDFDALDAHIAANEEDR